MNSISLFFQIDQQNLSDFNSGKISGDELRLRQEKNLSEFKDRILTHGLPDDLDADSSKQMMTLILHLDMGNMETAYKALVASKQANIEPKDMAYLQDKILVGKGLPQIYGTQFKRISKTEIEFFPIENQENVNERRAGVGLDSIEEYEKFATS